MTTETRHLLSFALQLARVAGWIVLAQQNRVTVDRKADATAVTAADRAAEAAIRRMIRRAYPQHGILGEERGATGRGRPYQWIIDPLDGTEEYSLGLPLYGVLIGLLHRRQARLGVVRLPALGATLHASTGHGCWYREPGGPARRARCASRARRLAAACVSFSGLDVREARDPVLLARHARVAAAAQRTLWLGGCLHHVLVARGRIDAAIDTFAQPWDAAAIVACVRESGGIVSTTEGDEDNAVFGGSLISSANRQLHSQLIERWNHPARAHRRH